MPQAHNLSMQETGVEVIMQEDSKASLLHSETLSSKQKISKLANKNLI